ncbi:MAG: hypothetical protein E7158_02165 [Firmicutes bacterium]|nr:hypothetical protein [Bacillota bacterium]
MKDKWIIKIFILTFVLAAIFGTIATLISNVNNLVLAIILLLVIFIGIIFDMVGVSVLTSKEEGFHALASKKKYGAKECITLLRNSAKISSICNDVIGDICGILSGTLGATLAVAISYTSKINIAIISIVVASAISTLTVGGKAIGKNIAVKKCDKIVFVVGKVKKSLKIK